MPQDFDPYYKWLAIPPQEQPPNHYRLLGIPLFTRDPEVVENAADQRMAHLRAASAGKRAVQAQQILNELADAKVCLLNSEQRAAYDDGLKAKIEASKPKPLPAAREIRNPQAQPLKNPPEFRLSPQSAKPKRSAIPVPLLAAGALVAVLVLGGIGIVATRSWRGIKSSQNTALTESAKPPATSVPQPSRLEPENKATSTASKVISSVPHQEGKDKAPTTDAGKETTPPPVSIAKPAAAPENKLPAKSSTDADATKADRIARLESERKTALANGDLRAVFAAVDELAGLTGGDLLNMKIEAVVERSAAIETPAEFQTLARQLLDLLQTAVKDGRSELPKKQLDLLLVMARKSADQQLEREATLLILQLK
jgi:hypothetical protein